jgi:hypothetical protein
MNWLYVQAKSKSSTSVKDGVLYFTMSQILMGIGEESSAKNSQVTREIAAILRGLGCEQGNTRAEVVPGVRGRYYSWKVE